MNTSYGYVDYNRIVDPAVCARRQCTFRENVKSIATQADMAINMVHKRICEIVLALESEREQRKKEVGEGRVRLTSLERDLKAAQQLLNSEIAQRTKEVGEDRTRLTSLERDLKTAQQLQTSEVDRLNRTIQIYNQGFQALQPKWDRLKALEDLNIAQRFAALDASLATTASRQHVEQLEDLTHEYVQQATEIVENRKRLEQFGSRLIAVEQAIQQSDRTVEDRALLEQLRDRLETLRGAVDGILSQSGTIAEDHACLDRLSNSVEDLTSQCNRLETRLKNLDAALASEITQRETKMAEARNSMSDDMRDMALSMHLRVDCRIKEIGDVTKRIDTEVQKRFNAMEEIKDQFSQLNAQTQEFKKDVVEKVDKHEDKIRLILKEQETEKKSTDHRFSKMDSNFAELRKGQQQIIDILSVLVQQNYPGISTSSVINAMKDSATAPRSPSPEGVKNVQLAATGTRLEPLNIFQLDVDSPGAEERKTI